MVPTTSSWELTPRQSIEIECARRGRDQVVAGCVALLRRHEVDDNLVIALGGPMSQIVLDDGPRQANQYWRRVWGARGLLHCYDDQAEEALTAALADEHWRVREMALKVVAKHRLGAAFDAVASALASVRRPSQDRVVVQVTRPFGLTKRHRAVQVERVQSGAEGRADLVAQRSSSALGPRWQVRE